MKSREERPGSKESGLERPPTNESASLGLSSLCKVGLTPPYGVPGEAKATQPSANTKCYAQSLCVSKVEGWVKVPLRPLCLSTHNTIINSRLSSANELRLMWSH